LVAEFDALVIVSEVDDNKFLIYPNPTNCVFKIVNNDSDSEGYNVRILTALGQVVFVNQKNIENVRECDISNLPNGLYFVYIQQNTSLQVFKIVKN